ncbi:ANTAR domain-containing protein [Knoellia sp. CPCC 206453]|uniref:ANTAR domain-containing protein n=1 Tax=Knoellia pratensis TaxID=3404796 RepID=UPI003613623A
MTDTDMSTHPHEEMLLEVSGVLSSVDGVQDYLDRVVHAVRRIVTGCDEVGITLLVDGRASTAAYTTVTTLEIDAVQYQLDQGPCLEAARTQTEVIASLGEADERWPQFAQAVRSDGMRSLMAMPLVSDGDCVGALNLYGSAVQAFDRFEASVARVAATRAADAIVAVVRLDGAQRLAGQLEQAMASRAVIEQAKGALMAMRGIDEHAAFEWLRESSQRRNVKVRDLAEQVVAGVRGASGASNVTGVAEGSTG